MGMQRSITIYIQVCVCVCVYVRVSTKDACSVPSASALAFRPPPPRPHPSGQSPASNFFSHEVACETNSFSGFGIRKWRGLAVHVVYGDEVLTIRL